MEKYTMHGGRKMHDYRHPLPADWQLPTQLPDLRRVGIIALDTETNDEGLRADLGSAWPWHGGYVCGISVAYRAEGEIRANYFPLRHPDTQNFDPEQVYQWLRDHIASDVRFITQNGLYDFGWLRSDCGILMPPSERLEEIGALAALVDENRFSYSLDSLCAWRGIPGKDETLLAAAVKTFGERVSKKKNRPQSHIYRLPARYVGLYAEADPAATLALFENLNPTLDREGTRAAYRLEVDLLPMVLEMRLRGIRIDTAKAEQARDLILQKRNQKLAELSEKLGANVGMEEIGRTAWLATTFDQHKIPYPRTEKGNPSFTAGNTGWMSKHPHWLPQLIVKADKYNNAAVNVLETYILGHAVDGRIHAEIHPHRGESNGTKSFRFSYSDPPLQLMPSRDRELAPLIRGPNAANTSLPGRAISSSTTGRAGRAVSATGSEAASQAERFVITINLGAETLHFDKPRAVGVDDTGPDHVDTAVLPAIAAKPKDNGGGQPL
jgi:DNA polymerase I-like protein with 3'-5' exonuclease and polymerase domains